MFNNVIKILSFELQKKIALGDWDVSELQKAIKVLRDGTGYIVPFNGEDGDGKVQHVRFDEL